MIKVFISILLFELIMISGCSSTRSTGSDASFSRVNLNGIELKMTGDLNAKLTWTINDLFKESDDYYELIVTERLIESLKENEEFIEIDYPDIQVTETNKFNKIEYRQVFIPLSGKYSTSGQVTLFYGTNDFSSTPLLNSNGQEKLQELIERLKQTD